MCACQVRSARPGGLVERGAAWMRLATAAARTHLPHGRLRCRHTCPALRSVLEHKMGKHRLQRVKDGSRHCRVLRQGCAEVEQNDGHVLPLCAEQLERRGDHPRLHRLTWSHVPRLGSARIWGGRACAQHRAGQASRGLTQFAAVICLVAIHERLPNTIGRRRSGGLFIRNTTVIVSYEHMGACGCNKKREKVIGLTVSRSSSNASIISSANSCEPPCRATVWGMSLISCWYGIESNFFPALHCIHVGWSSWHLSFDNISRASKH